VTSQHCLSESLYSFCACGLCPYFSAGTKDVKESRNRPGMAQRVPEGLGSQIFMTFGN